MARLAAEFPAPAPDRVPPPSTPFGTAPCGPGGPVETPPPAVGYGVRPGRHT